jgi:predicted acylesterase/phospholipase RssA
MRWLLMTLVLACGLTAAQDRPRVGLVLSGGGARGLAHVGVLKVLDEQRIRVDAIAGTSMGAIVGGLYASGLSAQEVEREVRAIDWARVFEPRPERQHLSQRRKEEDFEFSALLEFGMRDGELRAPVATVTTRRLESLLRRYSLPVRTIDEFDKLPIPFRAVATDLDTGAAVVLDRGDLSAALRSSMSKPGVFSPIELDGRVLGDGGLVNNVPIDVARAMGVDVVIVVNVGTTLAARETSNSALGVTAQMINILTEQNVQRSLATMGDRDVLVSPQLGALTWGDFARGDEFIALGERGAQAALARLQPLARSADEYARWRADLPNAIAKASPRRCDGRCRLRRQHGDQPGAFRRTARIAARPALRPRTRRARRALADGQRRLPARGLPHREPRWPRRAAVRPRRQTLRPELPARRPRSVHRLRWPRQRRRRAPGRRCRSTRLRELSDAGLPPRRSARHR